MSTEWEKLLRRAEDCCTGCGKSVRSGEIVTTLDVAETGFRRQDWCISCFDERNPPAFSFWRRRILKGVARRRLDLAYLCELLKRLEERNDAPSSRLRWIAALLLLRKRMLEEVGREHHDGVETLVLRFKKEDREFRVTDPRLDADAISAIEADLARMFDLEGNNNGG
ncbi:MAG: hypothetical protein EXS14_03660 [Planctomycetes bacterium]|nr:hypothetical protein [Planctomycetota bacterium]